MLRNEAESIGDTINLMHS